VPCALVVAVPQAVPSGFLALTVAPLTGPFTAEPETVVVVATGAIGVAASSEPPQAASKAAAGTASRPRE
jgi:hypothetical protein